MTITSSDCLKRSLICTRPNTSLIDKEILSTGDHLRYDNSNWVRCWYDTDHKVEDEKGQIRALRAITTEGELFGLVYHEGKKYPFHADTEGGEDAIKMARLYWARRKITRSRMSGFKTLRRDILTGRRSGTVLLDDAARAGLCRMGTNSFMRRMGLKGRKAVPGRIVALMSFVEPQAGLVLQAAFDRIAQDETEGTTYMAPAE